ncbi:MAG: restriction endonuclease [Herpetosiphon sp.]
MLWVVLLLQGNYVQFVAGLLPVAGGILVGRMVKRHVNWHAGFLSAITALSAVVGAFVALRTIANIPDELQKALTSSFLLLVPFPAFGVITSARSEQRARELRNTQTRRGGKLDRPGRVKTVADLQALSLNQLGGYVADLFRHHGFLVDDFQFDNKENLIQFNMHKDDEPWIVRVTVDDKVKQGMALQLHQYLKAEGLPRGVLITSMEFQDQAVRWAKDKPVALIDGSSLLNMND